MSELPVKIVNGCARVIYAHELSDKSIPTGETWSSPLNGFLREQLGINCDGYISFKPSDVPYDENGRLK